MTVGPDKRSPRQYPYDPITPVEPYPQSPHMPVAHDKWGKAAMACGIIAFVCAFIPVINFFTWPLNIVAIGLGAYGWKLANDGEATNKNVSLIGLALGVLAFFALCSMHLFTSEPTTITDAILK